MRTRTILNLALALALAGEALAAGSAPAAAAGPQVNINTATAAELQLLPRVGPALAQRIIEFRTANGPFKAAEELVRVKGIGERSYSLLQPYLAVSGGTTLKEKVRQPRAARDTKAKEGESH
ncbi:MAG: helix-hairpin-helix domain-containing protein [Acidobacteriota bacterium]